MGEEGDKSPEKLPGFAPHVEQAEKGSDVPVLAWRCGGAERLGSPPQPRAAVLLLWGWARLGVVGSSPRAQLPLHASLCCSGI